MAGYIYEAIRELNEALTAIEDIIENDTALSAATVARLTKIKATH